MSVYELASTLVESNGVKYSNDRTRVTGCVSKKDFLARLHCIRLGSTCLMQEEAKRRWLAEVGRSMLSRVLAVANADVAAFDQAWNSTMHFVEHADADTVFDELLSRGCAEISLFDCIIDYVLLEAFEGLDELPSSVTSVMSNSWVPRAVKEKTLCTAIWSVLTARRSTCIPEGLMTRFYEIVQHVSPVLACGLLGCHQVTTLQPMLIKFKEMILTATREMFQFDPEECRTIVAVSHHM
ncbi:uncharacterized protein MONBRDRAFT_35524, partial [Monosiga brevicollis MX1]